MDIWNHFTEKRLLLLVNRTHPLPEDYEVQLITLPDGRSRAAEEAYEPLMEMLAAGERTGLAFDIVAADYQMLDAGQEQTAENRWLQEHCAEYGFILRYPKGKEDVTLINYESWHYRYVGKEEARYIMEQGITLEEYLE